MYRVNEREFSLRVLVSVIVVCTIAVCGLFTWGCSGKKDSEIGKVADSLASPQSNLYSNWVLYQHQNIKILHPPTHPQRANIPQTAERYVYALNKIADQLGIARFTDTLFVYYYTGFKQGEEVTGQKYPFAHGDTIFFWLPSFLGPTVMQVMLPRWSAIETRHKFLKHGLIALYDFSGQDYHTATLDYIRDSQFVPLAKLAVDTTVNSNTERLQTAEAASFVGFVMATFGVQALKAMYESPDPFDVAVRAITGIKLEELQPMWLTFANQNGRPNPSKK